MSTHPTLWYPRCSRCGHMTTTRAGLGDEYGPPAIREDDTTCQDCGARVHIDKRTVWLPQELELA